MTKGLFQHNIEQWQDNPSEAEKAKVRDWVNRQGTTAALDQDRSESMENAEITVKYHAGMAKIGATVPPAEDPFPRGLVSEETCCEVTGTALAVWNEPYKVPNVEIKIEERYPSHVTPSPPYLTMDLGDGEITVDMRRHWGVMKDRLSAEDEIDSGATRPGTFGNNDMKELASETTGVQTIRKFKSNDGWPHPEGMLLPFTYPTTAEARNKKSTARQWDERNKSARYRLHRTKQVFTMEVENTAIFEEVDAEVCRARAQLPWDTDLQTDDAFGEMVRRPENEGFLDPKWAAVLPFTEFQMENPNMWMSAEKLMNPLAPEGWEPYTDTPLPPYPTTQRALAKWPKATQANDDPVRKLWCPPITIEQLGAKWQLEGMLPIDAEPEIFKAYFDETLKYAQHATILQTDYEVDFAKWTRMYKGCPSDYNTSWPTANHLATEGLGRQMLQTLEIQHHRTLKEIENGVKHIKLEREIGGFVTAHPIWEPLFVPRKETEEYKTSIAQQFNDHVRHVTGQRTKTNTLALGVTTSEMMYDYIIRKLGYVPDYLRGKPWDDEWMNWTKEQLDGIVDHYPVAFVFVTLRGQANVFWLANMFVQNSIRTEPVAKIWQDLQLIPDNEDTPKKENRIYTFTVWESLVQLRTALIKSTAGAMGPLNVDFAQIGTGILGRIKPEKKDARLTKALPPPVIVTMTLLTKCDYALYHSEKAQHQAKAHLKQTNHARLDWAEFTYPPPTETHDTFPSEDEWKYALHPRKTSCMKMTIAKGIAMMDCMVIWAYTSDKWYRSDKDDIYTTLQKTIDVMKETIDRAYRVDDIATIDSVVPKYDWRVSKDDARYKQFGRSEPWTNKMSRILKTMQHSSYRRETKTLEIFLAAAKKYINNELKRTMEHSIQFAIQTETVVTRQIVTEHCIRTRMELHKGLLAILQASRNTVQQGELGQGNFSFNGMLTEMVMNLSHMFYLNINSQLQDWVRHTPLTPNGLRKAEYSIVDVMAAPRRVATQAERAVTMSWSHFTPTKPAWLVEDSTKRAHHTTMWHPAVFVTSRVHNGRVMFAMVDVDDRQILMERVSRKLTIDMDEPEMIQPVLIDFMQRYYFQLPMLQTSPIAKREVIREREQDDKTDARIRLTQNRLAEFFAFHGVPKAPTHDAEIGSAYNEVLMDLNRQMKDTYNEGIQVTTAGGFQLYHTQRMESVMKKKRDASGQLVDRSLFRSHAVVAWTDQPRPTQWSEEGLIPSMGMWHTMTMRSMSRIYDVILTNLAETMKYRKQFPYVVAPTTFRSEALQGSERKEMNRLRLAQLEERLKAFDDEANCQWDVIYGTVQRKGQPAGPQIIFSRMRAIANGARKHVPLTPHQFIGNNRAPNMYVDILPWGDKGRTVLSVLSQLAPRRTRPEAHTADMARLHALTECEKATFGLKARKLSMMDNQMMDQTYRDRYGELEAQMNQPEGNLTGIMTLESASALKQLMKPKWETLMNALEDPVNGKLTPNESLGLQLLAFPDQQIPPLDATSYMALTHLYVRMKYMLGETVPNPNEEPNMPHNLMRAWATCMRETHPQTLAGKVQRETMPAVEDPDAMDVVYISPDVEQDCFELDSAEAQQNRGTTDITLKRILKYLEIVVKSARETGTDSSTLSLITDLGIHAMKGRYMIEPVRLTDLADVYPVGVASIYDIAAMFGGKIQRAVRTIPLVLQIPRQAGPECRQNQVFNIGDVNTWPTTPLQMSPELAKLLWLSPLQVALIAAYGLCMFCFDRRVGYGQLFEAGYNELPCPNGCTRNMQTKWGMSIEERQVQTYYEGVIGNPGQLVVTSRKLVATWLLLNVTDVEYAPFPATLDSYEKYLKSEEEIQIVGNNALTKDMTGPQKKEFWLAKVMETKAMLASKGPSQIGLGRGEVINSRYPSAELIESRLRVDRLTFPGEQEAAATATSATINKVDVDLFHGPRTNPEFRLPKDGLIRKLERDSWQDDATAPTIQRKNPPLPQGNYEPEVPLPPDVPIPSTYAQGTRIVPRHIRANNMSAVVWFVDRRELSNYVSGLHYSRSPQIHREQLEYKQSLIKAGIAYCTLCHLRGHLEKECPWIALIAGDAPDGYVVAPGLVFVRGRGWVLHLKDGDPWMLAGPIYARYSEVKYKAMCTNGTPKSKPAPVEAILGKEEAKLLVKANKTTRLDAEWGAKWNDNVYRRYWSDMLALKPDNLVIERQRPKQNVSNANPRNIRMEGRNTKRTSQERDDKHKADDESPMKRGKPNRRDSEMEVDGDIGRKSPLANSHASGRSSRDGSRDTPRYPARTTPRGGTTRRDSRGRGYSGNRGGYRGGTSRERQRRKSPSKSPDRSDKDEDGSSRPPSHASASSERTNRDRSQKRQTRYQAQSEQRAEARMDQIVRELAQNSKIDGVVCEYLAYLFRHKVEVANLTAREIRDWVAENEPRHLHFFKEGSFLPEYDRRYPDMYDRYMKRSATWKQERLAKAEREKLDKATGSNQSPLTKSKKPNEADKTAAEAMETEVTGTAKGKVTQKRKDTESHSDDPMASDEEPVLPSAKPSPSRGRNAKGKKQSTRKRDNSKKDGASDDDSTAQSASQSQSRDSSTASRSTVITRKSEKAKPKSPKTAKKKTDDDEEDAQ